MSKHEPKVSKRKYISNMILAILLSLSLGLVGGFYLSKYIAAKTNTPKTPITDTTPKVEPPAEETKEVPQLKKEEQMSTVKTALESYYAINISVLNKVIKESSDESKTGGKTQEDLFKDKLYKYYENICAKDFLTTMKTYIYGRSLKETYEGAFFKTQEGSKVKVVNVSEYKDNTIKANATIEVPYAFFDKGAYLIPSSADFFGKNKGKGITEAQYKKLLTLKPTQLLTLQTYSGTVTVEKINDKLYITDYAYNLASTEITNVKIKEKTGEKVYTITDFIKKYLSK